VFYRFSTVFLLFFAGFLLFFAYFWLFFAYFSYVSRQENQCDDFKNEDVYCRRLERSFVAGGLTCGTYRCVLGFLIGKIGFWGSF
jgi:hypothetical protein